MDRLTLGGEQCERLFEADEQAIAKVKAVSAAFVRVGVFILRIEPLRDEPLTETGDLAPEHRFGGELDRAHVIAPSAGPLQQNFRFHGASMRPRAVGVCALADR